jgi:predicted anti-sigma-YlaC factor YlaD
MIDCKSCQNELANYLFEQDSNGVSKSPVGEHLAACKACGDELAELRQTMDLLDAWEAPEPSPYFDQKLSVLLREEQANAPASWFEKIRERLLFNTGRQFRPAMVGALALVLLLGGGSFAGVTVFYHPATEVQASAAVNDLQILDKNEQAIEQIDQLLQDDEDSDSANSQPSS